MLLSFVRQYYVLAAQLSLFGYVVFSALSIAGSQIALGAFLFAAILSLVVDKDMRRRWVAEIKNALSILGIFYFPAFVWLATTFASAGVGLNIVGSLKDCLKIGVFLLLPALFFLFVKERSRIHPSVSKYLFQLVYALLVSLSLAALHSLLETALGEGIPPKIPGPVTESGQIAMVGVLGVPLLLLETRLRPTLKRLAGATFGLVLLVSLGVAWNGVLVGGNVPVIIMLWAALAGGFVVVVYFATQREGQGYKVACVAGMLGLLVAALLVNGKRGPYVACVLEVLVVGLLLSPRITFFGGLLLIASAFTPPVYDRLADFSEHFFIGGGRFDMWKLGFQLIERYPLGLGFGNSDLMREFDPSLPYLHRHMHNNVLNIALECGILSAVVFVWWFYRFLASFFRRLVQLPGSDPLRRLGLAIVVGLIGWQFAGLVEYNFGDGEIRQLFLLLTGILLVVLDQKGEFERGRR